MNVAKNNIIDNFITHNLLTCKDVKIAVKVVSKSLLTNKLKLDLFVIHDSDLRKINSYVADSLLFPQDRNNHIVTSDSINDIISKLSKYLNKKLLYKLI